MAKLIDFIKTTVRPTAINISRIIPILSLVYIGDVSICHARGKIPFFNFNTGAPELDKSELPADQASSAILTIAQPGYYSIKSKSASGAKIEIVDIISGPITSSGEVGVQDGKIDALLDAGVYKIRTSGVKDATGKVSLTVNPFKEMQTISQTMATDKIYSGELRSEQQRSYGLTVASESQVEIEAVGRSLNDLRILNADGEPVTIQTIRKEIEPSSGHSQHYISMIGVLDKGNYTVRAYGGDEIVWSDGDKSQPFHIRRPKTRILAAGAATGEIGPFGIEHYEAPARYDTFRLELPKFDRVSLGITRGDNSQAETIEKNFRTPAAIVRLNQSGSTAARVEIVGHEGLSYKLRAVHQSDREYFREDGPHLVTIDVDGEGGDEPPATALLIKYSPDGNSSEVVGTNLPKIGGNSAWRAKFNLFTPTTILFEHTQAGPVAVAVDGVNAYPKIEAAFGNIAPKANGSISNIYELPAGYYFLSLNPTNNTGGVADVTIGPPGVKPDSTTALPRRSVISFGEHNLEKNKAYFALLNKSAQMLTGPHVTPLPADLRQGPVALHQESGNEINFPIKYPLAGSVRVINAAGHEVNSSTSATTTNADYRIGMVKVAPSSEDREIGVILDSDQKSAGSGSQSKTKKSETYLHAAVDKPIYFDIDNANEKDIRFDLKSGGLFTMYTLGRQKTSMTLDGAFTPNIAKADQNGPGGNAQITNYLRSGRYHARISANDTSGRAGFIVSPAPLTTAQPIINDGAINAQLIPAKGLVIPITITKSGDYRLQLSGLNREWSARLEDEEGWPLEAPGRIDRTSRHFDEGSYRIVVSPVEVDARIIVSLNPVVKQISLEGHGPHALDFGKSHRLTWREPAHGEERKPDIWQFSLKGTADIDMTISDGMVAYIFKSNNEPVGHLTGERHFSGKLPDGDYRIEVKSLAPDDKREYEISLLSSQLQPGMSRALPIPAKVHLSLSKSTLVEITAFAKQETIGSLKNSKGEVVERLQGRVDDWNLKLARRLPPDDYKLEVERLGRSSDQEASDQEERATDDSSSDLIDSIFDSDDKDHINILYKVLEEKEAGDLKDSNNLPYEKSVVHTFMAPSYPVGSLAVVSGHADAEMVLALEISDGADSNWRTVALQKGREPIVAWPVIDDGKKRRILAWVTGETRSAISISSNNVQINTQPIGKVSLSPIGKNKTICVGKLNVDDDAVVNLDSQLKLFVGSAPEEALRVNQIGSIAAQSKELWILSNGDCRGEISVSRVDWVKGVTLNLEKGESAHLPPVNGSGKKMRLWRAQSNLGQPSFIHAEGIAISSGDAIAVGSKDNTEIINGYEYLALVMHVKATDVDVGEEINAASNNNVTIPPHTARFVRLKEHGHVVKLNLSKGLAAFSGMHGVYANDQAITRIIPSEGKKFIIVNITDNALPVQIEQIDEQNVRLDKSTIFKRYFGAEGEISFEIQAEKGDHLKSLGAYTTVISNNGHIIQGADISLDGPSIGVMRYGPGIVGAWVEHDGNAPWINAEVKSLSLPQTIPLSGPVARYDIKPIEPIVLKLSSGSPLLLSISTGKTREVSPLSSGVEIDRFIPAEGAIVELISPHEGDLSGRIEISSSPVLKAHEGVNDEVIVSAGGSAVFQFDVKRESPIGFGIKCEPDNATVFLRKSNGELIETGLQQLRTLSPGDYFIEVRAPADTRPITTRLSLYGISAPAAGPPEEVVKELLEKSGLKKVTKK